MNTEQLLQEHYKAYPRLQIRDIFKFLYQSAYGCEHLAGEIESVKERICAEMAEVKTADTFITEQLDGAFVRVHLSSLGTGLRAETLARIFCLSAKTAENAADLLTQKLRTATELIGKGLLPFDPKEFEQAAEKWRKAGYPAVRHSEVFRQEYHPAYRVIAKQYISVLPLLAAIDKCLLKGNVKVALEGGSASGKTTLSRMLSEIYDCTVFHMDDFFLRPEQRTAERLAQVGGNIDRERFWSEVMQPLSQGKTVRYRKFDCSTMNLGEVTEVTPQKLVIIEGAYSMHPKFSEYYDLSVFLDVSPQTQKKRILQRNSPQLAKRFFEEWIPMEHRYFLALGIKEKCDIQIIIK